MSMTETDMPQSFKSNLARRLKEQSENRASDLLSNSLLILSLLHPVEGSDLGPTEEPFEPSASCIYDTKKRQLVTRPGLPRLRCCVCHLHHKRAMNSHAAVQEFFGTVLQQVCHFKVDVIAGDANAAAYKYYKRQEHQDLHNSSVAVILRENCNVRSIRDTHLNAGFTLIVRPKALRTQDREKALEQPQTESFCEFS